MNVLIVGLGIGQVYKEQLEQAANFVVTVDANPKLNPCFVSVDQALHCGQYDIGIICTPNFTHKEIAYQIAPVCNIVVVEKPGLQSAQEWTELCATFPATKILMAKNNMYRPQNRILRDIICQQATAELEKVEIIWENKNRIPKPGSWFTTKSLAWSGVSRDLMPHLLHMAENLLSHVTVNDITGHYTRQNWTMDDVKTSDYGEVTSNGIYDVDDYATLNIQKNNLIITCTANWKNGWEDKQHIRFSYKDGTLLTYDFGLCPNYVYHNMIKKFLVMDDYEYEYQIKLDTRIHEILELFDED